MEVETSSALSESELEHLIDELEAARDKLPEEALRMAQRDPAQVVPRLIRTIQDATAAARDGLAEELGNAHFYALFLLIEFDAKEALPTIVEAISLPDDLPYELFGDAMGEVVPRALALFAADQTELVEALIGNSDLDPYVRWAACESYEYLVRDGRIGRDEVVDRLRRHLREAIDRRDHDFTGMLVNELSVFAPREALDEISEAFREELIDEFLINFRDIEKSIARGDAGTRRELQRKRPTRIEDTVRELRRWGAFSETERRPASTVHDRFEEADFDLDEEPPFRGTVAPIVSESPRVGRNEPCPCGSGRKYKKCCGAPA